MPSHLHVGFLGQKVTVFAHLGIVGLGLWLKNFTKKCHDTDRTDIMLKKEHNIPGTYSDIWVALRCI